MAFRFVHAADIHLDSPMVHLDEYPGAPTDEIKLATRKALQRLVDLRWNQKRSSWSSPATSSMAIGRTAIRPCT